MEGHQPDEQNSTAPLPGQQIQPGTTITPSATSQAGQSQPRSVVPAVPASVPTPSVVTQSSGPAGAIGDQPASRATIDDKDRIVWTASEFVAHEKALTWYGALLGGALLAAGLVFIVTRDKITPGVILFCAFLFGVVAARKPRQLRYVLDETGLAVDDKYYKFTDFRAFSVADEGAFANLILFPIKRFGQLVTAYYDPQDEDAIIDLLGTRLPLEDHTPDMVDRFVSRIRF